MAIAEISLRGTIKALKTIGEVWAHNLKKLRGDRTQNEIAQASGVSLRAYNRMESGVLPKSPETIAAIARALECSETVLFLDQDLNTKQLTPQEALSVLSEFVNDATKPGPRLAVDNEKLQPTSNDPLIAELERMARRDSRLRHALELFANADMSPGAVEAYMSALKQKKKSAASETA